MDASLKKYKVCDILLAMRETNQVATPLSWVLERGGQLYNFFVSYFSMAVLLLKKFQDMMNSELAAIFQS